MDKLTTEEAQFIFGYLRCPDCGDSLMSGPTGGACINVYCTGCRSRFNLAPTICHGERISEPGRGS